MDDGVTAELRALRARAYGPDADIAADPVATSRLAELEAADRAAAAAALRPREPEPEPEPEPEVVDEVAALFPEPVGSTPDAREDAPADERTATPRPPKRLLLTWAGSLALVAVLAVAVTSFTTARSAATATTLPDDAQITHVTTLLPTGADVPDGLQDFSDGPARSFETFFGVETIEVSVPWLPGDSTCILLMSTEQRDENSSNSWSGYGQGCSAGAFPASLSFVVADEHPEQLRERYPVGTALQFVARETGVDVFLSEAPTTEATD
ncbi:hypothetical protein [Microbacterium radiodurans]|uniref:Uncharacterized protein n=1 Tax=Microbacterium radiodurans TaxID=661398 RepID=A0A5J5IST2_9MICO|nr:hypothetical protein [Microbacterium radiodurans]KAA9089063.1 hypothetical protein F6B42_00710 [Microbacterium radiodurans]